MNKERLQEYNEILSENNVSLEDINNTINELPDVGNMMEKFEINDCGFLFDDGRRINVVNELLSLCKNVTNCISMFERAFANQNKIDNLDLSNFDTSKVTNMQNMFSYNSNLKELDLSNFNTSSCTNFTSMFTNSSAFTSLDISNFDLTKCTSVYGMFSFCSNMKTIILPKNQILGATSAGQMIAYCYVLETLDLSGLDFQNANTIGSLLYNDSKLTDLKFCSNFGKGFTYKSSNNANHKLDLSKSTLLTHESLMDVINKLYDLNLTYDVANGGTLYTQELVIGATNLSKLTSEELNIVVQKGWVVS